MTFVVALTAGYLLGGIPTADWAARRMGLDLRKTGSGNPGANNAMRVGGRRLGANILLLEIAKGATAVFLGSLLAGDPGMLGAGVGAVNGNIHNPYRRFRGGQGLGITAGVLLGVLPLTGAVGILVIAVVVITTRSSPAGALAAIGAIVAAAATLPLGPWGIDARGWAVVTSVAVAVSVAPRQLAKLTRSAHPPLRPRGSQDRR